MSTYLFVYGTLKSDFENAMSKRLQNEAILEGKATVKGSLYDLGEYPAYVKDSKDLVHGELYHIIYPETLRWLDEYEEVPVLYLRKEIKATILGEKVPCFVYEYAGHIYQYDKIYGGVFGSNLSAGSSM